MTLKRWPRKIKYLLAVCFVVLIGIVSCLVWLNYNHQPVTQRPGDQQPVSHQPQPVFCTQEAKLCPDGSYVGRTGPNCEFSACPENITLPVGYTLESYTVEKKLETPCTKNRDCETPPEYMMMSRCPFVTLCLENKCNVVCPANTGR